LVVALAARLLSVDAFAAPAPAKTPAFDDPPGNLAPTDAKLDDVIARMHVANAPPTTPYREQWTIEKDGLTGTITVIGAGRDYRQDVQLGPFYESYGEIRGVQWRSNANAQVVLTTGVHERDAITRELLSKQHLEPGDGVSVIGEDVSRKAIVLQAAPPDGRKEWLFIDVASGRIVRTEGIFARQRLVTEYSDFRPEGALTFAHRITWALPDGTDAVSETLASHAEGAVAGDLTQPTASRQLIDFPDGATRVDIPATFVGNYVVVRITIAGRGLDCLLDSGAEAIFLNAKVASQLHLPSYGGSSQVVAGPVKLSRTIVPEIDVGTLTMRNIAVSTFPGDMHMTSDIEAVGLLGFDFINGAVIHVDYEHRKVEAIRTDAFRPETVTNVFAVPAALDDGVPLVPIKVGETISPRFIVDTGSYFSMIYPRFVIAHPDDVVDVRGAQHTGTRLVLGRAIGSFLLLVPTELKSLRLGLTDFVNVMAMRPLNGGNIQGDDYDGLIGSSLLRYFDVYFDYPHHRIVFAANTLFRKSMRH